jgi:hypothetical protein
MECSEHTRKRGINLSAPVVVQQQNVVKSSSVFSDERMAQSTSKRDFAGKGAECGEKDPQIEHISKVQRSIG